MAKTVGDSNGRELVRLAEAEFSKKLQFDLLCQLIAEQIYPFRADFISDRTLSEEFATDIMESTPAQDCIEFRNAIDSMLRPSGQRWFGMQPEDDDKRTDRAMAWSADKTKILYNETYRPLANYQRAISERDGDFAAFGNGVTGITENRKRLGVILQSYHLRSCAWTENSDRVVDVMYRKMEGMTLRKKAEMFGRDSLDETEKNVIEKTPESSADIMHVALPREGYEPFSRILKKHEYVSVYVCKRSQKILKEVGRPFFPYSVARAELRSTSQYGYSPAAMLGLIESRVLQAQADTILQAGELRANPPWLTYEDSGDWSQLSAGGVIVLDPDYADKRQSGFSPIDVGKDVGIGLDMKQDTRELLHRVFHLNKLFMPRDGTERTAYESQQLVDEYMRSAGPLMRPWINDNQDVLDKISSVLMYRGAFGKMNEMGVLDGQPEELHGANLTFTFNTPLQIAYDRMEAMESKEILEATAMAVETDPQMAHHIDRHGEFRRMIKGMGGARALVPEDIVAEKIAQDEALIQQQMQMEQAAATTDMATSASSGIKNVADAAGNVDEAGAQELAALMEQLGGDEGAKQQGAEIVGDVAQEAIEGQ